MRETLGDRILPELKHCHSCGTELQRYRLDDNEFARDLYVCNEERIFYGFDHYFSSASSIDVDNPILIDLNFKQLKDIKGKTILNMEGDEVRSIKDLLNEILRFTLEEKIFECPFENHFIGDKQLYTLRYLLNGKISPYRFCEPCFALYSIEDGKPEYVDSDIRIENLPIFIYKNKEGREVKLDPIDFLAGEAD